LTQIRHNTVILVEFYVGQFFQLIFFKRKHELAPRAPSRQPSEGERRSVPTRGHDMSFFKRIHDVGVGLFSFNVLMRYWKLVRGSDTFQLCGKRRAFRRKRGPTRLLGLLVACWSFGCWLCLSVNLHSLAKFFWRSLWTASMFCFGPPWHVACQIVVSLVGNHLI